MKLLLQWTLAAPGDWLEVDSADWPTLARRPLPQPGELGAADNAPGHIFRLNCQGVCFEGDHYAVEDLPGGACRVTACPLTSMISSPALIPASAAGDLIRTDATSAGTA